MVNVPYAASGRLVIVALAVLCSGAAAADVRPEQHYDLTVKVQLLEDRVKLLESRIRELEQQPSAPQCKTSKVGSQVKSRTAASAQPITGNCAPPYVVDADGLRHFRQECLKLGPTQSCEEPFVLDASGIKRVKLACLGQP